MINLRTGTPGACKTLSAVEALAKMIDRWEKHPEEARPIFVHGVRDLALPHAPVPLVEWRESDRKPAVLVPDWDAMPDGAFVLIDEAQAFFPPRSSASTPPAHVAWLNTHRHRGFDIEVITQHPKLIDGSLRALVGKHQHFRRLFGGQRSYCYEWDACSDSLSGLSTAVGSYYPFPKGAFKWYKSAEVHTKQRFKLPSWLLIPLVGVAIALFAIPRAYSVLSGGIGGKGLSAAAGLPSASAPAGAASGALAPVSGPAGIVQAVKQIVAPPPIAGCMATATRCLCIDSVGVVAKVEESQCRVASVTLGGLVPYDTSSRPGAGPSSSLSSSSALRPAMEQVAIQSPRNFDSPTSFTTPISTATVVSSRMASAAK